MRHRVFGHKLSRSANERQQLFKGLVLSMVQKDKIQTTTPKAKAIQALIESLVTTVKRNAANSQDLLNVYLLKKDLVKRFREEIVPQMQDRQGGYTRLVPLRVRSGDNAEVSLLTWSFVKQSEPKAQESPKKLVKKIKETKNTTKGSSVPI